VEACTLPTGKVLLCAERALAEELAAALREHGYHVRTVLNPPEAIELVAQERFPLAIISPKPAAHHGTTEERLEQLRLLRRKDPTIQVLLLVDQSADLAMCCHAVALGAAGFVNREAEPLVDEVLARLQHAQQRLRTLTEADEEYRTRALFELAGIAGRSRAMADLLHAARKAAQVSDAPLLVLGEPGTGKQLLAEAIHRMDPKRCAHPFLSVNCAAITGTLAESALFGHTHGAFTGATEDRAGYFRSANGGTVLLDEISELDAALQPKLLRVLQEGKVLPVGSDQEVMVDVRVIAASNSDLTLMVAEDKFREDLYQRLNVICLRVPPLRQRLEDIPLLFQHFLRKYAHYYGEPIRTVDPRVFEVIADALGPGNVRELENMVRRILAFKEVGTHIGLDDLPPSLVSSVVANSESALVQATESVTAAFKDIVRNGGVSLTQMVDECERAILQVAIEHHQASQADLAAKLGITRRTFYNKIKKHNITRPAWRSESS
jgi:DNA-binding NtrC family response regulator